MAPGSHPPDPAPEAKGAAFFDLDKTVVARSSTLAFGRPFYRAGMLDRRSLIRFIVAQLLYMLVGADEKRMERVRSAILTLAKGWEKERIEELVRETVDEVVAPLVYAEALKLMGEHQRDGRPVYIISAAPEEVVRPLARYLGVEDVIATRSTLDDQGRYTGELDFYAYGPGKSEAMRALAEEGIVSLPDSFAYSDGITDLPMLDAVGHPVAVNPDRALRRLAEQRGWEVLEFKRPVTIRTRLSALPKPVPIISGAAAVALAGGLVAFALLRARRRLPSLPPPEAAVPVRAAERRLLLRLPAPA
ncbi:MAG: HAD-IB family hydrolase [Actinomycetota bacterium]|nr:HAD-IB family hydrolase [Actinomycetota bacterium]